MSSETNQVEETEDNAEVILNEVNDSSDESPVGASAQDELEDLEESPEQTLEKAQVTIKDYFDQMMRLRAEMENNRKRAERDVQNAHKYALKNFTEALLPIIDSMEMGMDAASAENATLESIRQGSELTMNMFVQVLQKQGLTAVNPLGEKFNPEQHQAISMIEDKEADSNTVIKVMQKGFMLNDRLVRPAMVVVAK